MQKPFRYVDSPKATAQENMRIDTALLDSCEDEGIFRTYIWEDSSFTLGRFQKIESFEHPEQFGNSWAKRPTGGGLLLHGCDISYSIVLPGSFLQTCSVKASYEFLCSFIFNFYKNLGLDVCYAKEIENAKLSHSPFCQVGFEPYDLLINGVKIGGNAQRRTRKSILQHGSIPLHKDARPQSGVSLQELGIDIDYKTAAKLLKESFIKTFTVELTQYDKTPA